MKNNHLELKNIRILTENWSLHQIARAKFIYTALTNKNLRPNLEDLKKLDAWWVKNNLPSPSKAAFRNKKFYKDWEFAMQLMFIF